MKKLKLNNLIFSFFIFATCGVTAYGFTVYGNETLDFAKSFIENYDIASKYTHEYHPFILEKTKQSFKQLRNSIQNAGMNIDKDFLILGYQEDAIPAYTTDWSENKIDDESIIVDESGKEQSAKNIFGFLTGFVLKDCQWLEQKWLQGKEPQFNHILGRNKEFFSDSSIVFQKHALPNDFGKIINIRDRIERSIFAQDSSKVLNELIHLWQTFYDLQMRNASGKFIATQDIVFSISYAQVLLDCTSLIKKFFIGPDITYPIETLSIQKEDATQNAQNFIQILQDSFKPVNNESTAYIFSSFVDGVGKSTLLNNVINWSKYKKDFSKYTRCDNSSSQDSQIYQFDNNVFIVDLPAQISHFAFKPDGYVYTNIESLKNIDATFVLRLKSFISKNKTNLIENFENLKNTLRQENNRIYDSVNPEINFTIQSLNLSSSQGWIPFEFEEQHFIVNKNNIKNLKILVPLSNAHSSGLKEANPEQMLFMNGITMPQSYDDFIKNLIDKLKQQNVKTVVFVNFLSMYPRTSRENVRVNFILQYAKHLFKDIFKINKSFYKHTIYREQEIYQLLAEGKQDLLNSFVAETAIRMALFELMIDKTANDLTRLTASGLEEKLKEKLSSILKNYENEIRELILKKIMTDYEKMHDQFYLDRIYHNILKLNFDNVIKFSDVITNLFQNLNNEYFCNLWSGMNGQLTENYYKKGTITKLDNNEEVVILDVISEKNRDIDELNPFISTLRAQWYASLSTLLWLVQEQSKLELVGVTPLVVKKTASGQVCLVQKVLPKYNENIKFNKKSFDKFCVRTTNKKCWTEFENIVHCSDFTNIGTYFGVYAYGYLPISSASNPLSSLINNLVNEYTQEINSVSKSNFGMPTSILLDKIESQNLFKTIEKIYAQRKITTINSDENKSKIIQLFTKTICTLDIILKDVNGFIMCRHNEPKDFQASLKLFEKITLPFFFNISINGELFKDYSQISPIINISI